MWPRSRSRATADEVALPPAPSADGRDEARSSAHGDGVPVRPKVLHVLRSDEWGGTEVQVATLLVRTPKISSVQRAAVLATAARPGALADAGVPAFPLAGRAGLASSTWRLIGLLRRHRFDVIEAYGFRAGIVARLAASLGGRPGILIGIRGMHFAGFENLNGFMTRFVIAVERMLARTVRCYDANSRGAAEFLTSRGLPAEKFRVIPNGVETAGVPQATHEQTARPKVICVARLVQGKRHAVLLEALAQLRQEGADFECELVGDGPWLETTRALAAKLGLADRVSFLGTRPPEEVRELLAGADVFVLASIWEGLPGSVLEAMAAGLPVVGTKVNGIREIVMPGDTGLLVPPDDADALADALGTLLSEPELRALMGRRGRERAVADFSIESLVERKTALFREIAAARAVRR
jgi:glycosyltransferase involved in cell wall biosynthesis